MRRCTSARRSSLAISAASSGCGVWSMRTTQARFAATVQRGAGTPRLRSTCPKGTRSRGDGLKMGQRESANLSRRSRRKFSASHCERRRGSVRTSESVPNPFTESVRRRRRTRSHFLLLANFAGGVSQQRPQERSSGPLAFCPGFPMVCA
jgi:hypothetical protein